MVYDILIIGGGVIGGMVARELSKYQLSVCLAEKENDVSCGASKANSGIIHGGFDPEPGTLKAKLNALGVPLLYQAARELNVPYLQNGSLVCAFSAEEEPEIENLYNRGLENGISGLSILSGDQARELEPMLSPAVTRALHIPSAGIISPYELTIAAVGNAMDNGVSLVTNFAVDAIALDDSVYIVRSESGMYLQARYIINCAGLGSDKIARLLGDDSFTLIPRAGEYMLLDKAEGSRVTHTIFQIPSKEGKGILVSPTVHGNLLVGPTAAVSDAPDAKVTTPQGLDQVRRLSAKSVPSVDFRQVITSFTGIRASEKSGDFIIRKQANALHLAAIDSPGLTCCVAIAQYAVNMLDIPLIPKENWNGHREDPQAFSKMTDEEKHRYIQENPAYGKIICRCEGISEGEILDAIRRNPGARDIDGVKRRTRSGMGRCQGGFCGPQVMKLISAELGISMTQVTKKGQNSYLVAERIGEQNGNA